MNKEYRKADLICLFFISILGSLVGFLLTIFPDNKSPSYIIALSSCIAVVLLSFCGIFVIAFTADY